MAFRWKLSGECIVLGSSPGAPATSMVAFGGATNLILWMKPSSFLAWMSVVWGFLQ